MNQVTTKDNQFLIVAEEELNLISAEYNEVKTDLSYLEINPEDSEEVIEQKEKDAKKVKNKLTKIRTSIQKTAKGFRDGFNKASKDVIALEKPLTAPIIADEEFLKEQMNYRKVRAEKIANEIHETRIALISQYEGFYNPIFFGAMVEDQFNKILENAKESFELDKKQKEEQLDNQRKQAEENERLRKENQLLREKQAKEKAEADKQASIEVESEPRPASEQSGGDSELRDLHAKLSALIHNSTSPVDPKSQVIHKNTIQLLEKALGYLEFSIK